MERGSLWRPNVEISPSCPRCGSSNTKFCYYNNYSLTQPRYFCKGCRRYWTKGGSLRNVPIGGGCRKSRRARSIGLASSNSAINYGTNGKSFGCGYTPGLVDASHRVRGEGVDHHQSSSSSGPNIDLALVYANFLNQKTEDCPKPSADHQNVEISCDRSKTSSLMAADATSVGLPGWSSDHEIFAHDQLLPWGFDSVNVCQLDKERRVHQVEDSTDYGLPPLPGEESVSYDHDQQAAFTWAPSSNPELSLQMSNHAASMIQAPQEPLCLGPDDQFDDPNPLFGNWGPFDF